MHWVARDGLEVRRTQCIGLRATDWKSVVHKALGCVRRTRSPSYTMHWDARDGLEVRRTETQCVGLRATDWKSVVHDALGGGATDWESGVQNALAVSGYGASCSI